MTLLKRELTTFDLTMISIGGTIGSGIFLTPSTVTQALGSPFWIILVWVVGGLMTLSGALTFAELSAMMPRAGGVYVFLNEAFGGIFGFLYGWAYFLVANTGAIAALSVAFATYFGYFVPIGPAGIKIVALSGIALVTVINILGVKVGGVFSDVFTVLKLAAIAGLIVVGLGWGSSSTTNFGAPLPHLPNGLGSALALALVGVLWSYGGWQHATFTAGEAKDPRKSVPLALIIGSIVITLAYLLTVLAYMFLLPTDKIAASPRLATDAIETILGTFGGGLIAVAIFISTFGTTGIYTLTAPRIYYAMARDGVFFKKVAELHPKYSTPMFAIVFQSLWAMLLILFWGTFENLISYVVFTDWIFFALAASSVFVLRKRSPHAERPYRTLGYPVTPIFFISLSSWFVLNTLFEKPAQAWAGLGFLALGVPVYYLWRRRTS
jgi:APA family basic amino acid/polyamine antiporter